MTPDKYLPHRYAGASGDFNPIHIDAEFAKTVGLPSNILHGLYSMGLVAKANARALAGGDPRALKRLSVQFRGMGLPEQEIVVSGTVKSVEGEPGRGRHRRRPGRQPDHPQRRGRARALARGRRGSAAGAPRRIQGMLTERQELILRLVVDAYLASAQAGAVERGRRAARGRVGALDRARRAGAARGGRAT